ncbi:sulfotransferase domain-containing protein [Waterburya agarophytonicola K14]|uniref:Sulfotransferase domain-containing protein n=1 Tax=Waterburya agarophytonicola KI4 TaxID=2874699 RepID=A0A964BRZ7_9CYAN|nr:sulfotransferase domain-containing protein [Waterburya agarophytonicola]MCC0177428.1 sulfotransferase domain-containing protein [Waterburya agarophytonicola KI4]
MSKKKPKFCVITTPRSGSTWLATLLDSHPKIKSFEEPFIWRADRPNWTDKQFPTYYDYKTNANKKSIFTAFKYLDILDSYKSDTNFDIIGFKIMYNQIQENPEIMLKLLLDNYRIIHLIRQNYLDVIISRAAKNQHHIAHSNTVQSKTRQVTIDTSYLIKDLDRCTRNNKLFSSLLKIMPLSVLEITYESMQEDYNQVLCSVAEFLEVSSDSITFKSELKRINQGKYSDKIANYDEVLETLSGSSYTKFLKG